MARWDYTIKIKDLIDHSVVDSDAHAVKIAPLAAARIAALANRLKNTRVFLSFDLEEIAYDMREVNTTEDFDTALCNLYDLGDGEGIWIS